MPIIHFRIRRGPVHTYVTAKRKSLHFAMARTKQTAPKQNDSSSEERRDETPIASEKDNTAPEQVCSHLKLLYVKVRAKEVELGSTIFQLTTQENFPVHQTDNIEGYRKKKEALETELQTLLGEITLITCPVLTCETHNRVNDVSITNANNQTNLDESRKVNDKLVIKTKQLKKAGEEEFKLPEKASRTIKEIPIEQVVCTSNNKFAVLEVEEEQISGRKSSDPPTTKPIMLRIVNDYNLIVQDVNRKFPATVNKMAGKYIKIQPATPDNHCGITTLLEDIKAEHYIIKRLADRPIKVVIKGLPVKTDVAGHRGRPRPKGLHGGKGCALRKFSTKEPLPIFMVEVRRTEMAELIYDVKNICYLCVTIDPFWKKPEATQCYNCNYFNHSSKNYKMTPRCLKCGKNHRTGDCTIAGKIEKPRCINCNQEGHVASLRSCAAFPKIKPKKGESPPTHKLVIKIKITIRSFPLLEQLKQLLASRMFVAGK
ncbi:nucleic-acid-binding protein from transposon X-element [Trichonephila clavipes]|nr:nucleic-acid-binding protein from transposon X-element [Trichonephila clavipes]